jgi:hypothetical protein
MDAVELAYLKAMQRAGKKAVLWEDFDPSQKHQLVLTPQQMATWKMLQERDGESQ